MQLTQQSMHLQNLSKVISGVIICGRRGPEHAAFTAPELRDLPKLENTDVYIDTDQINQAASRIEQLGEVEKDLRNNLEAMRLNCRA